MIVVGVDEVGRGSWAGPLCVAAVALDAGVAPPPGLTDSKLLSKAQRHITARHIRLQALSIGIGWVPATQLDEVGLSHALRLATGQALRTISVQFDKIIIDGLVPFSRDPRVEVLPKADLLVPAVSAASIIAKVARDTYMGRAASRFPGYGFERHVGYGTPQHRAILNELGPCSLHRFSFAPIRALTAT